MEDFKDFVAFAMGFCAGLFYFVSLLKWFIVRK